jgi:DNA-binding NtrC family response regulator
MERDAIVQGLLAYQGNKVKTAESLGMSRATIYRKIHEYGIVIQLTHGAAGPPAVTPGGSRRLSS